MSDMIPGSSWDNPVWHRGWRIYAESNGAAPLPFTFAHDDFDGAPDANDNRCGQGKSVQDCKAQIDDHEDAT